MPADQELPRGEAEAPHRVRHDSDLDRRLVAFADRRSGVVTTDELRRAGYSDWSVQRLIARGTLHRVHRGVYAVGLPTIGGRSRAHAAVLAYGAETAADWRTAAALHDLGSYWPDPPQVVVARPLRPRAGVQLRRVASLDGDVIDVGGIPTLTITRLVLDAAQAGDRRLLERTFRGARKRGDLDEGAVARRSRHRRGSGVIRQLLDEHEPDTTNDFERTVYELLDGLGLPEPLREHRLDPFVLDFFFPTLSWCLEADGYATHGTYEAFVADRDRDRELYGVYGVVTTRIPHRDATRRPERVRGQLADAAARRAREVASATTSLIA